MIVSLVAALTLDCLRPQTSCSGGVQPSADASLSGHGCSHGDDCCAESAASDWQTHTNGEAGFSIRYAGNWSQADLPPTETTRGVALDGPEGAVELYWGSGFGGYCPEATTIEAEQGELPACYSVDANGVQRWDQINKELPAVSFSGRALTKDATPASGTRFSGSSPPWRLPRPPQRHHGGERLANLRRSPGRLQH